jgi:DNA-directed RNA polymerase specialized sigma24 family protein
MPSEGHRGYFRDSFLHGWRYFEVFPVSRFNPDFWEVVVERSRMEAFAEVDAHWHEHRVSNSQAAGYRKRTREAFRQILDLIRAELTHRQREVVQLHFLGGLTEPEVGMRLDIPQQVVSQHLHGVLRKGKRVGGAIPKLRKLCRKRGITW